MDILNTLINEKGTELVSSLVKQGFDNNTASGFLQKAGSGITSALSSGKVDLNQGSSTDKVSAIISSFDIPALAASVGINPELAQKGLTTLAPALLKLIGDNPGIASLLSGSAKGGDLLNMAKKFF